MRFLIRFGGRYKRGVVERVVYQCVVVCLVEKLIGAKPGLDFCIGVSDERFLFFKIGVLCLAGVFWLFGSPDDFYQHVDQDDYRYYTYIIYSGAVRH